MLVVTQTDGCTIAAWNVSHMFFYICNSKLVFAYNYLNNINIRERSRLDKCVL